MNDAFTLRYKKDTLGSAFVPYDKSKVTLTNVPSDTYLVVQNSSGAWAKKITTETSVSARDMNLDSFANCKVWLEKTDTANRMTYAALATEEQGYDVNITAGTGDGLTVTNGTQGVAQGDAITDITVEAASGYYLPDDYLNNLRAQQLNGLTVTKTDKGFKISGTPTSNVNITLQAATAFPKADTPIVNISKTATSITATVTNHKPEFGDIEYKWDNGEFEKDKNTLSDLQAETAHALAVRFKGNGFYQVSEKYCVEEITTLKDGSSVIVVPANLTATYKEGLKLSEVAFPADSGWSWVNGDTPLPAGTNAYSAIFDTTNLESTTDFSGVEGYNSTTHKVTRNIEVQVDKADSQVNITTQTLDKEYNGNAVNVPEYTTSGSDGKVTIKWQENTGTKEQPNWEDLNSAPSTVGTYRVVVELAGNDNYNSAGAALEFVISQATNAWTEELSITGWTYGEQAKEPKAKAKFGDAAFTYSSEENGTYTSEVPGNAGTWYVKASVAGTTNYTGLESAPLKFEIKKAASSIKFKDGVALDKVYDGNAVNVLEYTKSGSDGEVTIKWQENTGTKEQPKWEDLNSAPSTVGTYQVVVELAGNDNYNSASEVLEFVISQTTNTWTEELSITGWTYGEQAKEPKAKAKFGDAAFTYSSEEHGTYTSEVPGNAGTWYVKASVAGTENYTGLESAPVAFEIAKAIPTYEKVTGLVLGQGQALSKIELP